MGSFFQVPAPTHIAIARDLVFDTSISDHAFRVYCALRFDQPFIDLDRWATWYAATMGANEVATRDRLKVLQGAGLVMALSDTETQPAAPQPLPVAADAAWEPERDSVFLGHAKACAALIGKDDGRWEGKDLVRYFVLLAHRTGCHRAESSPGVKDFVAGKRLLKWRTISGSRRLVNYCLDRWKRIKEKYRITGVISMPLIWGYRDSLWADVCSGGKMDAPVSVAHRSKWTDNE